MTAAYMWRLKNKKVNAKSIMGMMTLGVLQKAEKQNSFNVQLQKETMRQSN